MVRRAADERGWRFARAVARVEATIDEVVADHATSHVGSVLDALRKRLRSRHVEVSYAETTWDAD